MILGLLGLVVLNTNKSLLLLIVEHLIAFDMAEIAHIAHISESVVMVEASLASPVTHSLLVLLLAVVGSLLLVEAFGFLGALRELSWSRWCVLGGEGAKGVQVVEHY